MNEVDRRSFLVLWLEAWLLVLFPSLRAKPEAAAKLAEGMYEYKRVAFKGGDMKISILVKGFEVDDGWFEALKESPEVKAMLAAEGIEVKT